MDQLSFKRICQLEGGYSNDPVDRGGETNLGITQSVYDTYRQSKTLEKQSVRFISESEAMDIYDLYYWKPMVCDSIPEILRFAIFQFAVNCGVGTAVKRLQGIVGTTIDGKVGEGTLEALMPLDHKIVTTMLFLSQIIRYYEIVLRHPEQGKFLRGWLGRVNTSSMWCGLAASR